MSEFEEFEKAVLDRVMKGVGYRRVVRSTDFHPLPESEWSPEELDAGHRTACKRNEDDPTRLDVFVQFKKAPEFIVWRGEFQI